MKLISDYYYKAKKKPKKHGTKNVIQNLLDLKHVFNHSNSRHTFRTYATYACLHYLSKNVW